MIIFAMWLKNNHSLPFIRKIEEKTLKRLNVIKTRKEQEIIFCTFCGKPQNEVSKITQSETGVSICNECVVIWNKLLNDK